MYRSPFCKISWAFFGAAFIGIFWMLWLTGGNGVFLSPLNIFDISGVFPISAALTSLGIVTGVIGVFQSRGDQSHSFAAIAANVMFLIVLLLFEYAWTDHSR